MNRRAPGFTIVELMIALVILAVLLAIAAPSYRTLMLDSRMTGEANEFLTTLTFARSEAIKRNGRVTVCKSAAGTSCVTSGNWAQGWIAFVDLPAGTLGTFDGGDTILRVHGALNPASTLVGTTDVVNYVSFVPDGRSLLANDTAQGGTLDLCADASGIQGRRITIALGRASAAKLTCP
jgi:type IV fimbrial biogenesis protein FimT